MRVVYCDHYRSPKENIGDVLSAQAIRILYGNTNTHYCVLPNCIGHSSEEDVLYGGGGMIRPHFYDRPIFKDYRNRNFSKAYGIVGVGLNRDEMVRDFSSDDLYALREWIEAAKTVIVRDRHTQQFVENCLHIRKVNVTPCPTYTVLKKVKQDCSNTKYSLGIVPSFGHTASYYKRLPEIHALINELIELVGGQNTCIICHDRQDYEYASNAFGNTNTHVYIPQTFSQMKACYMSCNEIITVRGHGIIFAAACGVPCSVVSLNIKMDTLYEFHYGSDSLGINFDAQNHLWFLKEKRTPINHETPSKGTLFP